MSSSSSSTIDTSIHFSGHAARRGLQFAFILSVLGAMYYYCCYHSQNCETSVEKDDDTQYGEYNFAPMLSQSPHNDPMFTPIAR